MKYQLEQLAQKPALALVEEDVDTQALQKNAFIRNKTMFTCCNVSEMQFMNSFYETVWDNGETLA